MRRWLLPALVLGLGLWARLAPWPHVFTTRGVVLRADTDPHYHVLRAERILVEAPGAPWTDAWLGWPTGAEIPWPPLFDAAIAGAARLASRSPTRDDIAGAGALLVVAIGLLTLPLVAALARRLGHGPVESWLAAAVVALVPAIVQHSEVGRVDQHGAELLLFTAILLVFATAVREPSRAVRAGVVLGVLFALAFWTWLGSAVLLAFPAAFVALDHVGSATDKPRAAGGTTALAVGGGIAGLLLAITIGLFGPPGALLRGTLLGVSSLHVGMTIGVGAFAALLLVARGWPGLQASAPRRAGVVLASLALPLAATLGPFERLRAGVETGVAALFAGNPWFAAVGEFSPLLFAADEPLTTELRGIVGSFGLTIPLAVLAIPAWRSQLRSARPRWCVAFEALLLAAFLGVTFFRQRFMGYAMVPLSLALASGLGWLAERLSSLAGGRRLIRPAVLALGLGLAVEPSLQALGAPWTSVSPGEEQALRWLRSQAAPRGHEGVMCRWSMGHAVQYFAGRPAVASPFGTEGGAGSMERWARFWFATDQATAEAALGPARASDIVLDNPSGESMGSFGLAPPGTPPAIAVERDVWNGARRSLTPAAVTHVVLRLYFMDGLAVPGGPPALDAFQLRYESPPAADGPGAAGTRVKIFRHVAGFRLNVTGVRPGADVAGVVHLTTNQGRSFDYGASARAKADGTAVLRLPYGTGLNGLVEAGRWTVFSGDRSSEVSVAPDLVAEGSAGELAFGSGSSSRTSRASSGPSR